LDARGQTNFQPGGVNSASPRCRRNATDNLRMVRQEKAYDAEGESPSRLNMHDHTKT